MRIFITEDRYDTMDMYGQIPNVGDEVTLVKRENINTGESWYNFAPSSGAAGNMNSSIRRYHGWRGTTNNVSSTAMGLRRVNAITRCKNRNWQFDLSEDLKPYEE